MAYQLDELDAMVAGIEQLSYAAQVPKRNLCTLSLVFFSHSFAPSLPIPFSTFLHVRSCYLLPPLCACFLAPSNTCVSCAFHVRFMLQANNYESDDETDPNATVIPGAGLNRRMSFNANNGAITKIT